MLMFLTGQTRIAAERWAAASVSKTAAEDEPRWSAVPTLCLLVHSRVSCAARVCGCERWLVAPLRAAAPWGRCGGCTAAFVGVAELSAATRRTRR